MFLMTAFRLVLPEALGGGGLEGVRDIEAEKDGEVRAER